MIAAAELPERASISATDGCGHDIFLCSSGECEAMDDSRKWAKNCAMEAGNPRPEAA